MARKTLAQEWLDNYSPVFLTSLSKEQREVFAAWIVKRLSELMPPKEIREILKMAHKQVPVPSGKPGKWRGAYGIQMVREVQVFCDNNPGKSEENALKALDEFYRKRFGNDVDLRRRYYEAKNWATNLNLAPRRKRMQRNKKRTGADISANIRTYRPPR